MCIRDRRRTQADFRIHQAPKSSFLVFFLVLNIWKFATAIISIPQFENANENQLQSIIEGFFRYAGTSGWSYPSIVGSGENATILHYKENNSPCKNGEIVLIDAGAEFRGYAADITRSWPTNGIFTEPQKELYQIVLDSQIAAINECVPGNPYTAPHEAARRVLAEGLIKIGVISQTLEEALDSKSGQLKDWYMHNTSHWIGLDAVSYTHLTLPTILLV